MSLFYLDCVNSSDGDFYGKSRHFGNFSYNGFGSGYRNYYSGWFGYCQGTGYDVIGGGVSPNLGYGDGTWKHNNGGSHLKLPIDREASRVAPTQMGPGFVAPCYSSYGCGYVDGDGSGRSSGAY